MALIKWDYEGGLIGNSPDWWVEKVAKMEPDPYEEEECCEDCEEEEYEEEEEEEHKQKTLEEMLREYNNVENPWYEVRDERCMEDEENEEDDEIKGHIESFLEAFKVPKNKRKRVREILKKKNSERTQEEKDFLKELINRTKKIEVPKIQIVRQDEDPNDDEGEDEEEDEEISADEIEKELEAEYEKQLDEELRRHRSIESLKSQIYEYRDKITDTRGWGDLDDPSAEVSYDWSSVAYLKEMEDFLKKFEK